MHECKTDFAGISYLDLRNFQWGVVVLETLSQHPMENFKDF